MKFNVEVDCTPEEARQFLGLPDVAPMQKEVMEAIRDKMMGSINSMETSELMAQWLPMTMKGMEQFQSFWSSVLEAGKTGSSGSKGSRKL